MLKVEFTCIDVYVKDEFTSIEQMRERLCLSWNDYVPFS